MFAGSRPDDLPAGAGDFVFAGLKPAPPPGCCARALTFGSGSSRGRTRWCPFPLRRRNPGEQSRCCHITWTNEETKQVILENLHRSPLYGGKDRRGGPRYCPSIEDKIVRFADKERHQVFIEPCGLQTEEMYLQGMSSSLPEDVQLRLLRTIPGLGTRPGDAHRLCHRIRLLRSSPAGRHAGIFGYPRALRRGTV